MTVYVLKDDYNTMDDYGVDMSMYCSEAIYGVFDNLEQAEKALSRLNEVAEDDAPNIAERCQFTIVSMELNKLGEDYNFMADL